jgi:hypothetical protein
MHVVSNNMPLFYSRPTKCPSNSGYRCDKPRLLKSIMGKNEMNSRFKAVWLGASMALIGSMTTPAMADEWNKKTEFEFSGPVEVPGKLLDGGKYVFQLLDTEDRNIVQIFSVDPEGNQRLVTTIMAVPDYLMKAPDKPIVQFEERRGDSPEAIHSWFYPGDNYGWEFVYPKSERLEASSDSTTAVATAPVDDPAPEPPPVVTDANTESTLIAEETISVTEEEQFVIPSADSDGQQSITLPETAGNGGIQLLAGIAMLGCGMLTALASFCKSQA